jgi:hypothetical protein
VHGAGARARGTERGGVLVAAVLLVAVAVALSAALMDRASQAAAELRARRDVLCARYAALGGLALGTTTNGDGAAFVGPRVDSLVVSRVRLSPAWCVLRASASCDGATRTLDRALADTSLCDGGSP